MRCILLGLLISVMALGADKPQLPEGPGKDAVLKVCANCHGPQIVLGRGHTFDQWTQIVANMAERGAEGTDDEFAQVIEYLTKNFPPSAAMKKINVNKASAEELKGALGLTAKEAESIVQFRQQNGDYKSADQIKKVPGVDPEKIEAKKNRLTF